MHPYTHKNPLWKTTSRGSVTATASPMNTPTTNVTGACAKHQAGDNSESRMLVHACNQRCDKAVLGLGAWKAADVRMVRDHDADGRR
jgi:hypothetical protein